MSYSKIGFSKGQTLTAANMNHIEGGVASAHDALSSHTTDGAAHNDIRLFIEGLATRLNALADSDDTTLDQLSEIVAYIKSNKTLIDAITTSKVSVVDIVDNLTTNVSNKPLSAAQGVALKALIDAIVVPTKFSQLENDSGYLTESDKADIVQTVIDSIGVPVYGFVDDDNNIVLIGELSEDTYYIKYEMDDGSVVDIGELSLITEPTYTNFAEPTSDDWLTGYRLSTDINGKSAVTGAIATNKITVQTNDIVYVEGINFTDDNNRQATVNTNNTGGIARASQIADAWVTSGFVKDVTYDNNTFQFTNLYTAETQWRFSGLATGTNEDVIIKIKRNGEWL